MPPARWTIALSPFVSRVRSSKKKKVTHNYRLTLVCLESECENERLELVDLRVDIPVVPLENRIHKGQSKGNLFHSISP